MANRRVMFITFRIGDCYNLARRRKIYPPRSVGQLMHASGPRKSRLVLASSARGTNGGLPRVGTYRILHGVGYRLSITPRGACRTSPTYAREILHATRMARPTINYGGTWYSIHEMERGETLRSYT